MVAIVTMVTMVTMVTIFNLVTMVTIGTMVHCKEVTSKPDHADPMANCPNITQTTTVLYRSIQLETVASALGTKYITQLQNKSIEQIHCRYYGYHDYHDSHGYHGYATIVTLATTHIT